MPYSVGEKGSYGCSGYPVVKEGGEVMGCHDSVESANSQVQALYASEAEKVDGGILPTQTNQTSNSTGVGIKRPEQGRRGGVLQSGIRAQAVKKPKNTRRGRSPYPADSTGATVVSDSGTSVSSKFWEPEIDNDLVKAQGPCWDGYVQRGMKPGDGGRMVPNCVPLSKADAQIVEGDFVIAIHPEGGAFIGQVEHVMLEGGTYGEPGNPYAVESTPENPAVAIRILEEDDGTYYYTPYSVGALMSQISRVPMPNISMEDYEDKSAIGKAEGYSPPAGARSAARRAIKFKEDGKANGAGTAVGWTRAGQLARGETLSLSTVKRMYSYFSRHEVDKKGKDWGNQSNPSNGYIMWLAWGGDAGYSWSRGIVEREKKNKFWAGSAFGK